VSSDQPDRVARGMVVGLTIGLVAGLVLAAPSGGDALLKPVLVPLLGMLGGALVGAVLGLAFGLVRPRADGREVADEHVAVVPAALEDPSPPARAEWLAQPPPWDDGSPAPEGWYTDPLDDSEQRWWDGEAWTGHVWRPRRRR
jgi:hypothetical protein